MLEIGSLITEVQQELFSKLLTENDLENITKEVGVELIVVKNIFYRKQPICEENICVVYKMINKAFEKTEDAIVYFSKVKSELNQMLPK